MIPFLLKSDSISMFPAGQAPVTISSDHMNFQAVRDALVMDDYETALEFASVPAYVASASGGNVTVSEQGVEYQGQPITGYLANKMVQFFREGLPVQHYCLFLDNLMANPSMTSRNELFLFLEAADLPITDDGCFLAYKAVDPNFMDKHSHTFSNAPGAVLEMPRRDVDDNRNRTCSYGFHAAAYTYAKNFLGSAGDRLVAVKINPADVVSVPSDYQNQKLRTCKYTVEFEIPGAIEAFAGRPYVDTSESDYFMWSGYDTNVDAEDDDTF